MKIEERARVDWRIPLWEAVDEIEAALAWCEAYIAWNQRMSADGIPPGHPRRAEGGVDMGKKGAVAMKKMHVWHGCSCRCTVVSQDPHKVRLGPGCKRIPQEMARRLEQMATAEEQEAALRKVR